MDPAEFQLHIQQNLHRMRLWCEANDYQEIRSIPWGRMWDEIKAGLNWDTMHLSVRTTIEQAWAPAKQKLEAEGVLFPEGWDRNLAHAPRLALYRQLCERR